MNSGSEGQSAGSTSGLQEPGRQPTGTRPKDEGHSRSRLLPSFGCKAAKRIVRGEDLEAVSRDCAVAPEALLAWKVAFLSRQLRRADSSKVRSAAEQLGALGPAVREHQVAADALVRALHDRRDPDALGPVCLALRALAPYVDPSDELVAGLVSHARGGLYMSCDLAVTAAGTLAVFGTPVVLHRDVLGMYDFWERGGGALADTPWGRDEDFWWPGSVNLAAIEFHQRLDPAIEDDDTCLLLIERWRRGKSFERGTAVRIVEARHRSLLHHRVAVETLLTAIHDDDDDVCSGATYALIAIGADEDCPLGLALMVEALRAPIVWYCRDPHELDGYNIDLRCEILLALERSAARVVRDGPAMAAIEAALKGPDAEHRQGCAGLLERLSGVVPDHPPLALLLVDALLNWDPAVRETAARALHRLGPGKLARSPEVLHMLGLARQYGTPDVQWVLGRIDPPQSQ